MRTRLMKHSFIWPLAGCVLLWILTVIVSGKFSINQLFSSAKLASFALLLALGQMMVVTSGDGAIDLSQQYILTLCAYISCSYMNTVNPLIGFALALLAGGVCGLVNGVINIYLHVPAMITTLASGYIIYTVILLASPALKTLPYAPLVKFINLNVGGLSAMTMLCIFVAAVLAVLLYRTGFGKKLHCVGQKRLAAHLAGISVEKTVITAFILDGLLCALAGVLLGAFIGGAFQDMGTAYFLPTIAATFVGGTLASGGRSNVIGVCLGALMMSFMTTFLNVANLAPGMQRLIQGIILVLILMASVSGKGKQ